MATVSHANTLGTMPNLVTSPEKYTTIDTLLEYNAPDNRELLVKTYGDQGITGFLKLTGAISSGGTADQVQYWEEQRRHRLQTVATGAAAPGANTAATLDAGADTDIDVRPQDVVMSKTTGDILIVLDTNLNDAGGALAAGQFTVKRLDHAQDFSAAIPDGDELIILGNMFDQGTDQPDEFFNAVPTLRTNPYMIVKDTFHVNGSQATNVGWVNVGNGDYRWFIYGEQETRARFMDRREMMMLFAERTSTDNADAIADMPGGVAGSEGYFAAIADRGITVNNATANPIDSFAELDDIIIELDKQGAPSEYAVYVNRAQDLAFDNMLAAGVSGGVTAGLASQFGAFQNDADLAVQLGFKSFTRGGYTFHKHDWKLLNDPTLLGASSKFVGAMIPMSQVVDARTGVAAPALEMNYKETNGYSRELEHWVTGGGVLGYATDGNDVAKFHYRSEIALITRAANQHVAIKG
jgi:hypothetical protein